MPTYDYQCQGCGEIDEIFMSMSEATEEIVSLNGCTNCGNTKFKKTITQPPGIAFVGSGFYVNDYGKKK
jgi:putative FmdB family regulatory protein